MSAEESFQSILLRWSEPVRGSPCDGCPLRSPEYPPKFGIGNRQRPRIVVVAESPNDPPGEEPDRRYSKEVADPEGVRGEIDDYWRKAAADSSPFWRKMARTFDKFLDGIVDGGKSGVYFTNVWKCTNSQRGRQVTDAELADSRRRYIAGGDYHNGAYPPGPIGNCLEHGVAFRTYCETEG